MCAGLQEYEVGRAKASTTQVAVGESSVLLLHPPLPSVCVSIETRRECQQNDSLADGYTQGCVYRGRRPLTTSQVLHEYLGYQPTSLCSNCRLSKWYPALVTSAAVAARQGHQTTSLCSNCRQSNGTRP